MKAKLELESDENEDGSDVEVVQTGMSSKSALTA